MSCNRKLQNSDVMTNLSSKSNPLSDNEQTVESIPMNGPGLQAHNSEKQFKLSVDVSDTGARAVLWQKHDNGFDPVCYFYKKFTKHQKNYSSVEKEALAMVMALQYFKIYVKNTKVPVIVYTEHNPLRFIAKMKDKNEKILRWTLVLQLYNIKIVPISGKSKLIPVLMPYIGNLLSSLGLYEHGTGICRRGSVREIRCDRGTNFIGAEAELKKAIEEMDDQEIKAELLKENIDWIKNPACASNFGGVWERQIRSIRSVMNGLIREHGRTKTKKHRDEETLRTFLCEAEYTINNRPLTVETPNDPLSAPPLSPSMLLTGKT